MTYYVTALTNDKARVIISETRTTDREIAELVAAHLESPALIVVRREEE